MLIIVEIIQSIERQQTVTTIVKKGRSLQVTKRKQYPVLIINKYRKSRVVASKSKVDKKLCTLVDYYYEQLRLLLAYNLSIVLTIFLSRASMLITCKKQYTYNRSFAVYINK
jgi:hypothetical protein